MASTPVVPLPVLVERVDLHPPSGVGHRAGRGPRPSGPGTVSRKGGRPQTGNSGTSVPPLAAAELRRRSHGPLPGPSPGPPPSLVSFSPALLSRPSERGRPAAPTGNAQHYAAIPARRSNEVRLGSQTRSGLHHDLRRAAFPRRRLLRPPPPCFPPLYLAQPLQQEAPLRSSRLKHRSR
uniref:Uncharacterized protein n=1 Tax=Mus musculus TaxID=10090 RepID=Q8C2V0_MOUSE|nr:unnamed protein product [Mus musculus]